MDFLFETTFSTWKKLAVGFFLRTSFAVIRVQSTGKIKVGISLVGIGIYRGDEIFFLGSFKRGWSLTEFEVCTLACAKFDELI